MASCSLWGCKLPVIILQITHLNGANCRLQRGKCIVLPLPSLNLINGLVIILPTTERANQSSSIAHQYGLVWPCYLFLSRCTLNCEPQAESYIVCKQLHCAFNTKNQIPIFLQGKNIDLFSIINVFNPMFCIFHSMILFCYAFCMGNFRKILVLGKSFLVFSMFIWQQSVFFIFKKLFLFQISFFHFSQNCFVLHFLH